MDFDVPMSSDVVVDLFPENFDSQVVPDGVYFRCDVLISAALACWCRHGSAETVCSKQCFCGRCASISGFGVSLMASSH